MNFSINRTNKKILKERTKEDLMQLVEQNAKNGWKMISEIKCDYRLSSMMPYQVLVQRQVN